jgi:hypothetical protein
MRAMPATLGMLVAIRYGEHAYACNAGERTHPPGRQMGGTAGWAIFFRCFLLYVTSSWLSVDASLSSVFLDQQVFKLAASI